MPTFHHPNFSLDHAKIHNSTIYTTGQIGGGVHGNLVSPNIKPQAEQMFKNLEAILEEAASGLDRVLSANIFLVNEEEYGEFNEVYLRVC
jgi:2-iminobutanoate/2-iminopropanoate deaminase